MKVDNKRNILENAHITQNDETYYQFAGLKYNPAIIQETSKLKIQGCRLFLNRLIHLENCFCHR